MPGRLVAGVSNGARSGLNGFGLGLIYAASVAASQGIWRPWLFRRAQEGQSHMARGPAAESVLIRLKHSRRFGVCIHSSETLKAAGAILVATGRSSERRRYSIAHELGHFLIPAHQPSRGSSCECSLADLHLVDAKDRDRRRRIEAEANRFAAHLLMPPGEVRARIRQSQSTLEGIVAMAREFGVSKEAMARSWVEAHRQPVAIVLVHRGRVVRWYRSDDFPWLPEWNGRLPDDSLAAQIKPGAGVFSTVEEVDPDVWLSERDAKRVLRLTEQVLGQRDGYALALLQAELDDEADR